MDFDLTRKALDSAESYLAGLSAEGYAGKVETTATAMAMTLADFVRTLHWYMNEKDMLATESAMRSLAQGLCGTGDDFSGAGAVLGSPSYMGAFNQRGAQEDGALRITGGIMPRGV